MAIINLLDNETANLIAAGEVVDRPAAVVKELLENAIDAGSLNITVEIKNGGSALIRVTDDGKGMAPEDVKNCVLRHATSKIKSPEDLEGISTLGFRGEALAAISAVSRFQIISKEKTAQFGTVKSMEGEKTLSFEEIGCPDGTTVTVRDIFFNVPARRKFLKKDATETAYISQYVERIALSHPDIGIKFIVDSRVKFSTQGNGSLADAIYAVYGREFLDSLAEIDRTNEKVTVKGFVSLPELARINRNYQILFVNNRLVRSRTISYAVEDAYKSFIMTDRFPAFILFIDVNPYLVDINVHPSKLEVRFADETTIREAVYFAVKNFLETRLNVIKSDFVQRSREEFEKTVAVNAFVPFEQKEHPVQQIIELPKNKAPIPFSFEEAKETNIQYATFSDSVHATSVRDEAQSHVGTVVIEPEKTKPVTKYATYKGILFNTYIIAEYDDNAYLIDKHAAHERIIYESLKNKKHTESVQSIISTSILNLTSLQYQTALDNIEEIAGCGFEIEPFGDTTFVIRGVPSEFSELEISTVEKILIDMIDDIIKGKSARLTKAEIFDRSLYSMACKAATKAGYKDDEQSYIWLINKLFDLDNVFCCPHGRPIIVKYTKAQIEKMFFRS